MMNFFKGNAESSFSMEKTIFENETERDKNSFCAKQRKNSEVGAETFVRIDLFCPKSQLKDVTKAGTS